MNIFNFFSSNPQSQNVPSKNNDVKNIALTIVGVFIVLGIVAGSTFAYYTFTSTDSSTINGTAATANGIKLAVSLLSTSATGALVPQPTAGLKSAIRGKPSTSSGIADRCVDTKGSTVCKIYDIKLSNTTGTSFVYNLEINFNWGSGSTFTNLKWAILPAASLSATTNGGVSPTSVTSAVTSVTNIATNQTLAGNVTESNPVHYYIVVWLNDPGTDQATSDHGTFSGTIVMQDTTGNTYLTSAFNS